VGGDAEDTHPAGGVLDDGQDVESGAGQGGGFEGVRGDDGPGLGPQERRPGLRCPLG
jgi:hypothetical protein